MNRDSVDLQRSIPSWAKRPSGLRVLLWFPRGHDYPVPSPPMGHCATRTQAGRSRPYRRGARWVACLAATGALFLGAPGHLEASPAWLVAQPAVQTDGPSFPWQGTRTLHNQFQVNLANGNVHFLLSGAGYRISPVGPAAAITLSFNTLRVSKPGDYTAGFGLGQGWSTLLGSRLDLTDPSTAVYTNDTGFEFVFNLVGGAWIAMDGIPLELVSNGSQWVIHDDEGSEHHFDAQGRHSKIVSRQGNEFTITHGSAQVLDATDPLGRGYSITYQAGKLHEMAIDSGQVWTYDYDSQGRLDEISAPGISNTKLTYTTQGQIQSLEDSGGDLWQFDYYTSGTWSGRVKSITDPGGHVESYAYIANSANDQTAVTDIHGETWRYWHNRTTLPALVRLKNPLGKLWKWNYNANYRVLKSTDPLQRVYSYAYNTNGDLVTRGRPSGAVTKYSYDAGGNMLSATLAGSKTEFQYEDPDNPDSMTKRLEPIDANGQRATTVYSYYGPNDGPVAGYWHGLLKSVVDPNGVETRFTYNTEGQTKTESEGPVGAAGGLEIRYDQGARRVHTDLGGMEYPGHFPDLPALPSALLGALDQEDLDPFSVNWRGQLDQTDLQIDVPIDSGTGIEVSTASETFSYDHYGRSTTVEVETEEILNHVAVPPSTLPVRTFQTSYFDDSTDPRFETLTPDGDMVVVRKDEAGRTSNVAVSGMNGAQLTVQVNRRDDGRVSSIVRNDGTAASVAYTTDGRVQTIVYFKDGSRVLTLSYAYNQKKLPISITEITSTGVTLKSFDYDSQGRLTEEFIDPEAGDSRRLRYSYDLGGNRLGHEVFVADQLTESATYHYDLEAPAVYKSANNRLTWIERHDGASNLVETEWFFYDNPFGNVSRAVRQAAGSTSLTATAYVYSVEGHPWLSWDESWDDFGSGPTNYVRASVLETRQGFDRKRMWRTRDPLTFVPDTSTEWVTRLGPIGAAYSVDPQDGSVQQLYMEVDGIGRFEGATVEQYMASPLGTVRLRDAGATTAEQDVTAFGDTLLEDSGSDFGFAGGFGIRKSLGGVPFPGGSIPMGYRHYAPRHGRFMMRDPLGIAGGVNVYAFAGNSPTIGVDPTGLATDWVTDGLNAIGDLILGPPKPRPPMIIPVGPEDGDTSPVEEPVELVPVPPWPTGPGGRIPLIPQPPAEPEPDPVTPVAPPRVIYRPIVPGEFVSDGSFVPDAPPTPPPLPKFYKPFAPTEYKPMLPGSGK